MKRNSTLSWLIALLLGILILVLELLYRAGLCSWATAFNTHSLVPGILLIVVAAGGLLFRRK